MDAPTTNNEGPKKYIRTFAGDLETFKEGGTPDLAPFAVPETPPAVMPAEAPQAMTDVPPVAVPAPVLEPVLEQKSPEPRPTPLKTYSGDFSNRLKEANATTATVLAAEQDATPREPVLIPEEPKSTNVWYIITGVVLLITGIVGAYFAYSRYITALTPVVVAPSIPTPIFVDESEQISGSSTDLMKAFKQSLDKPLALNAVRLIALDLRAATSTSVFSAVAVRAPSALLRNVDASLSMAGIVRAGSEPSPFFILSVTAYGPTFSGMLSWEPHLQSDLDVLFPLYRGAAAPLATTTPVATTTPAASAAVPPVGKAGFADEVVSNHDVRVYRDARGQSVLLYGYWDQATLIIARDPSAFSEIVARLATSHAR